MKRRLLYTGILLIIASIGGIMFNRLWRDQPKPEESVGEIIQLPKPKFESDISLEQTLLQRKSIRFYRNQEISISEIGQLLWAAQGITRPGGYRTAPSAGAIYPLEVYLLAGNVSDFPQGLYKYEPEGHRLVSISTQDKREELSQASLGQEAITNAPAVIVISAVYERTTWKYQDRGIQYVHMEVGSAAENIYLQATSLNLGTVFIGAFYDDSVKQVLGLDIDETPLCIMPVGWPEDEY